MSGDFDPGQEAERHRIGDPVPSGRRAGQFADNHFARGSDPERDARVVGGEGPGFGQRIGGGTRRRPEVLGAGFLRGSRLDTGMIEIGQGPAPDAEVIDQPSEAALFITVAEAHCHGRR